MAQKLPASTPNTSVALWTLFGAPPLLRDENAKAFDELLGRISDDVCPTDTIEKIWVWDTAVLTWEIMRYRHAIAGLLTANESRGLKIILDMLLGVDKSLNYADRWALRDPETVKYVDGLLDLAGLTMEDVRAQTLSVKINDIERIDGMVTRLEARRNSILREIDRRRSTLSAALRKSIEEIEEGEFREIGSSSGKSASPA